MRFVVVALVGLCACSALNQPVQTTHGGAFAPAARYDVGPEPWRLAMADFDGDGTIDLAATGWMEGGLQVLLGKGDGTFRTAVSTSTDPTNGLAAGDLNADQKSDVALAAVNKVLVLTSKGDGTFAGSATLSLGSGKNSSDVVVADFNADGKQDVVVVDQSTSATIFLGSGNGMLSSGTAYAVGEFPFSAVAADIDGDSKMDLAVIGSLGAGTLNLLRGLGDGTFQKAAPFDLGGTPNAIRAADVTGDGIIDLLIPNHENGELEVMIGVRGGFPQQMFTISPLQPFGVVAADFDGDGHVDVAVTSQREGSVEILWGGTGDAAFETDTKIEVGGAPHAIVAGDFDKDGKLDIAVADDSAAQNAVSVLLNRSK